MADKSQTRAAWFRESVKERDFFQEYSKLNELGRGASAVVYRVLRQDTGQLFAAKIIEKASSKVIRAEITALIRLNHPNVIKLHELYETSSCVILVLQLLTGGELFDRIVQRGYYSEDDAASVVRQMLDALSYLHQNGIVHRDLKPENILYEDESEHSVLRIADFGLAKDTAGQSQSLMHTVCGTPNYLAPETVLQIGYDYKVDVWSTGVITYILLSGYEPFDDERGYPAVLNNIVNGRFEFHSPWWDDVSMNAKDFVTKLLKVKPEQRPTAREALEHSWLRGNQAVKGMNLVNAISKLKQFNARRKLKAASQAIIASNRVLKTAGFGRIQSTDL